MLRLLRDGGFVVLLGGLIALVGCGGGGEAESGDKPAAAEKEAPAKGLKQVDVAKLPKVGDSLPPQDNGRVEPAPPEGWKAAPRDQKYVARFSRKTGELPRIDITAADSPFGDVRDLTDANAADVAARLQKEPGKRALVEPFKPLKIGDRVWSRHVRKVKVGSEQAQIQSLQTIVGGRLYAVELIVSGQEAEDLLKERDNGYAVAANLKFAADEKNPPITLPPETPAAPPAEGAPPANPTP